MYRKISNFLREEEGLTTVEYAVAGALIAAAVILTFQALGVNVGNVIRNICNALSGPGGGGGACP